MDKTLFMIFIEQHDDCHCYARHEGLHQEPVPGGGGGDHAAHRHRVRRGEHGRQLRGGEAEHEPGHQPHHPAAAVHLEIDVFRLELETKVREVFSIMEKAHTSC